MTTASIFPISEAAPARTMKQSSSGSIKQLVGRLFSLYVRISFSIITFLYISLLVSLHDSSRHNDSLTVFFLLCHDVFRSAAGELEACFLDAVPVSRCVPRQFRQCG